MPIYIYKNPETNEVKEVFQTMVEPHVYREEIEWTRIFLSPQASIDTQMDEFSSTDFVEKTRNKKGSLGDLWDKSKELSDKREKRAGVDELKQQNYKDYSKTRRGRKHPDQQKEERKTNFKDFKIEY